MPRISTDEDGFIYTDTQIQNDLGPQCESLARKPPPFETSIPRVFAVGDVRQGSMKRVAAAIGPQSPR
jgi:thioredoxin reductase (NADPH)